MHIPTEVKVSLRDLEWILSEEVNCQDISNFPPGEEIYKVAERVVGMDLYIYISSVASSVMPSIWG